VARGFSGVVLTFNLAIVFENQIIQRWKFRLEYGSGGQHRQAGVRIGIGRGKAALA
jgi:hypothetical protein